MTLHAEWLKIRGVLPVALGSLLLVATAAGGFLAAVGAPALFYSSGLVTWGYAFLAITFVTVELRGLGAATFTATARRGRVLAAKLALIAAIGLIAGAVVSVATAAVVQAVLAARGQPPIAFPVRAIALFLGVSMAVQGVLGGCAGVLVRSAPVAMLITALCTQLPVSLAAYLGDGYAAAVPRWVPGAAVESLAGVSAPGSYGYLPPVAALLCVAGWLAVACAAAAVRLPRMDIR